MLNTESDSRILLLQRLDGFLVSQKIDHLKHQSIARIDHRWHEMASRHKICFFGVPCPQTSKICPRPQIESPVGRSNPENLSIRSWRTITLGILLRGFSVRTGLTELHINPPLASGNGSNRISNVAAEINVQPWARVEM
ncbi:hypothetical protein V3481_016589 [Fusarium oxysporum f. sp. vasinfectum]